MATGEQQLSTTGFFVFVALDEHGRQGEVARVVETFVRAHDGEGGRQGVGGQGRGVDHGDRGQAVACLLYTADAAADP